MKRVRRFVPGGIVLAACACALTSAAAETSSTASAPAQSSAVIAGLTSKRDAGTVSIMADPTLAGGRLVLKVVAYNQAKEPAKLSDENVKVFTAAGKAVPLMSLESLIDEVRKSAAPQTTYSDAPIAVPSRESHSMGTQSPAGEPDLGGYSGASNPAGGRNNPYSRTIANSSPENMDAATRQQVDGLKAAVLQPMTIAPASAAGGQVVTEKIKFSRKEQKAVRVIVDFNGELHEFFFEAPPSH